MSGETPARRRDASALRLRAAPVGPGSSAAPMSLSGGFAPAPAALPQGIWGKMNGNGRLPAVCRPAGWVAVWKRLAMVGAQNMRNMG